MSNESEKSIRVTIRIWECQLDRKAFAALKRLTPSERRAILSLATKTWLQAWLEPDLPEQTVSWRSKKIH